MGDAVASADGVCVAVALIVSGLHEALRVWLPLGVPEGLPEGALAGLDEEVCVLLPDGEEGGDERVTAGIRRTRLLCVSAMNTLPPLSTARPKG